MNNRHDKKYCKLISELIEDLKKTESAAQKLSAMIEENSSEEKTLLRLENNCRTKISSLLRRCAELYCGRIKIFPFPENADISRRITVSLLLCDEIKSVLKKLCSEKQISFPDEYDRYSLRPNIFVAGRCSSGKSALIRAVAPDAEDQLCGYLQTTAANFFECENISEINSADDANCIWYCIDGSGAQIQEEDLTVMKNFSGKILLTITKFDLMNNEERAALMNTLLTHFDSGEIVIVSAEDGTGLSRLLKLTEKIFNKTMPICRMESKKLHIKWENHFRDLQCSWLNNEEYLREICMREIINSEQLSPAIACKISGISGVAIKSDIA